MLQESEGAEEETNQGAEQQEQKIKKKQKIDQIIRKCCFVFLMRGYFWICSRAKRRVGRSKLTSDLVLLHGTGSQQWMYRER